MKCFTAIALALFSVKALSLPIITESNVLFRDHKNPKKLYLMPDMGGLQLSRDGKPNLNVTYWKTGRKSSGLLTAVFELKVNSRNFLEDELMNASEIVLVPVLSSTFTMNDSALNPLFEVYELPEIGGQVETSVGFSAILNKRGNQQLEEVLKNEGDKISLFKGCYEMSGVSPVLDGLYSVNLRKVQDHFKTFLSFDSSIKFNQILEEIKNLSTRGYISIRIHGGEGTIADYYRAITQEMIEKIFFRVEGRNLYKLAKSVEAQDLVMTTKLSGRFFVKKDVCVDMNLKGIQNHPELFSK